MNRRGLIDLVDGINAGAKLVLANLAALIEVHATAIIQRQVLGDFPFVLKIEAVAVGRDDNRGC